MNDTIVGSGDPVAVNLAAMGIYQTPGVQGIFTWIVPGVGSFSAIAGNKEQARAKLRRWAATMTGTTGDNFREAIEADPEDLALPVPNQDGIFYNRNGA